MPASDHNQPDPNTQSSAPEPSDRRMKWHRLGVRCIIAFILIFSFCSTSCRAIEILMQNPTDFKVYSIEKTQQRIANLYTSGDDPLASAEFRNAWHKRHGNPIRFEILETKPGHVVGWRTRILVEHEGGTRYDVIAISEDGLFIRFDASDETTVEHSFTQKAVYVDSSNYSTLPDGELTEEPEETEGPSDDELLHWDGEW